MLATTADVVRAHARVAASMSRIDARPRAPKVPSKKARERGAPSLPVQAERDLARAFVLISDRLGRRLAAIFLPLARKIGRQHVDERTDAREGPTKAQRAEAAAARAAAERAAAEAFSKARVRSETERAARRVEAHSKDQFRKLGIDPKREPVLKVLVSGWTRDVAERVKDMTRDQARKLEEILLSGHSRYADTLAREIEEQLGVTTSRAEFIARDSILTLNGQITRERFRAAEIEMYVWTTVGDDRVREEHQALEGEVFEVDGPGDSEEGHPGEPPNCRCVAYPLRRERPEEDE